MRTAIYARFSTDLQRDRSIDDQLALCTEYCAREGLSVVATFDDRARTGSSVFGRDGLGRMMEAARRGEFDVVLVEALDRLSRDQEDLAGIWKRLRFVGIELRAVHDGTADAVQIGVRGLLGSLFLADLAHKVRRGMAGVVRDGRHAGGRAYGYRPVPGRPGEMQVVENEAAVVRRIFECYVAGDGPREIACALNAEGLAPPRGRAWNASTINGNRQRGHGILFNEIYAGRLIWNRVRMVRDPDNGRRVSRVNPRTEWQQADAPHLRIVTEELWQAAQQRKGTGPAVPIPKGKSRRILSGLLRCGACGSGMSMRDRDHGRIRVQCSRVRESGACSHGRRYYLDTIERAVIDGLKDQLAHPGLIEEFLRAYIAERRRLAGTKRREASKAHQRLGEVRREMDRIIDAVANGHFTGPMTRERMDSLYAERTDLEAEIERVEREASPTVALHPATITRHLADLETLSGRLPELLQADRDVDATFRRLVASVTVGPTPTGSPASIEVRGRLATLLGPGAPDVLRKSYGGPVVAEEGLEPPTQGL
jgi:site-specific DNA recombinase